MDAKTQEKITQLQLMEQNLNQFLMQKQKFQAQLIETDNALEEIEKTQGKTYKIIGSLMVSADRKDLKEMLERKKQMAELRIKSMEKQETAIQEKAKKIQEEVLKELKSGEKDG